MGWIFCRGTARAPGVLASREYAPQQVVLPSVAARGLFFPWICCASVANDVIFDILCLEDYMFVSLSERIARLFVQSWSPLPFVEELLL